MDRVMEILMYHETEEKLLRRQLHRLEEKLREDLEEVYAAADVSAIVTDKVKVQSSIVESDAVVDAIERAEIVKAEYEKRRAPIEAKLKELFGLHEAIMGMEPEYKHVLLALYYPRASYRRAAEILDCSLASISKYRDRAIDELRKFASWRSIG